MQFAIPKITAPIDLGGYDERLRGQVVHAHVNPSRAFRQKRADALEAYLRDPKDAAVTETFQAAVREWFAELWSQHADLATHWTAEEIAQLDESDPVLLGWLIEQSMQAMEAFRTAEKKS